MVQLVLTYTVFPAESGFGGPSIMGESDLGIAFDVLQIEFLISRFRHIFPRLHQMLKAGALIYVGHQSMILLFFPFIFDKFDL